MKAFLALLLAVATAQAFPFQGLFQCSRSLGTFPEVFKSDWDTCLDQFPQLQDVIPNFFDWTSPQSFVSRTFMRLVIFKLTIEESVSEAEVTDFQKCIAEQNGWVTDEALDLQALQETIRNRTLSLSQKFQNNVEEGLENCSQPENFEIYDYSECVFQYCFSGRQFDHQKDYSRDALLERYD